MLSLADVAGRDVTIRDIDPGRLGWYTGSSVWSADPEIGKYHEFINQISIFQQKYQKISSDHMT